MRRDIYLTVLIAMGLTACGGGDGDAGGPTPVAGSCPDVSGFSIAGEPAVASNPANQKATLYPAKAFDRLVDDNQRQTQKSDAPPRVQSTGQMLSGVVEYERVPHNTTSNALNYSATFAVPARGVTVQLLDSSSAVLDETLTADDGSYSFHVTPNTEVRVRVLSQLRPASAPWDVQVVDNTQNDAVYALDGNLATTGNANQTRDLLAESGWTGASYGAARAAAPFAILDDIYGAMLDFVAVDAGVVFPELRVNWSPNNTSASSGGFDTGAIGTSFYTRLSNGQSNIFVLGAENVDTDEYDGHIIVHEWGHYFEDRLSRSDSIGGPHGRGDVLDMRVAFGEGFGNALSGIITDDPFYRDSFGTRQRQGFSIDVESGTDPSVGWYSEGSVQQVLYDLYDATNDAADGDAITLGLAPLYDLLTSANYRSADAYTSIFSFATRLRTAQAAQAAGIDALLDAQNIVSGSALDEFGTNETNNAGSAQALPAYARATVGTPLNGIFSLNDFGQDNKLANWRFVQVNIPTPGSYRIELIGGVDPDFVVSQNGDELRSFGQNSAARGREVASVNLQAGDAVMAVAEFENIDQRSATGADACLALQITRN